MEKTQRRGVHRKLPPIYKHNFVTFLSDDVCLISPAKPLPLHPLDVTCKDNSQKFKRKKNTLAVNLCKEIVAKNGKKTSLKEKTRYTACECYLQSVHLFKKNK